MSTPREILDAIRPLAEYRDVAKTPESHAIAEVKMRFALRERWPAIASILEQHDEVVGLLETRALDLTLVCDMVLRGEYVELRKIVEWSRKSDAEWIDALKPLLAAALRPDDETGGR